MINDCAAYTRGQRRPGALTLEEAPGTAKEPDTFVWVDFVDPTPDELEAARQAFGLERLAVEDAIQARQRPNVEVYEDSAFFVVNTAAYDDEAEEISLGEVMLFLGENYVVTLHRNDTGLGDLARMLDAHDDLVVLGPFGVLYVVVDAVVDAYGRIVDAIEVDIEQVEAEVFDPDARASVERIYALKRQVLTFARATRPLEAPLLQLSRGRVGLCNTGLTAHFDDVYDHVLRVNQQGDNQRELLASVLSANLTLVGVQQNDDMRKISAWVAIAAVPTVMAGIYGMNFDFMPELRQPWGYPAVLLLMVVVCVSLRYKFKRSGWL